MRERLSELLCDAAKKDSDIVVMCGDHGYSLFDKIRKECPNQFINCGVAEQAMIGAASGMAKQRSKPIVYGLASFVPIRVLEQIKLDICYLNLPVIIIGDGAGVVYSTLGASHHCGEDVAALRAIPNIHIYSPCDKYELEDCFEEAIHKERPCYIRIGKDKAPSTKKTEGHTEYRAIVGDTWIKETCLVATGSMVEQAHLSAIELNYDCVSVPRIKPISPRLISLLSWYKRLIILEEHSEYGGLFSAIAEEFAKCQTKPIITPFALKDQFADKCGSYQYALSEHNLDNESIHRRLETYVKTT